MSVLTTFAVLTGLLAAIGVYGLLAWTVNDRRRELAIRLALGAQPARSRGWSRARAWPRRHRRSARLAGAQLARGALASRPVPDAHDRLRRDGRRGNPLAFRGRCRMPRSGPPRSARLA